eukprot:tig00020746_g13664.t1
MTRASGDAAQAIAEREAVITEKESRIFELTKKIFELEGRMKENEDRFRAELKKKEQQMKDAKKSGFAETAYITNGGGDVYHTQGCPALEESCIRVERDEIVRYGRRLCKDCAARRIA